jgi:hypothetical protein
MSAHHQPDLVELSFIETRAKLIDIAAFLDRLQRHGQDGDWRIAELRRALPLLQADSPDRARQILLHFSDPSSEPIEKAPIKGATAPHRHP